MVLSNENAPDRTRTCNLRFRSPMPEFHKDLSKQELTENGENDFARNFAILQQHPELKSLIERWEKIPETTRGLIMAAIKGID